MKQFYGTILTIILTIVHSPLLYSQWVQIKMPDGVSVSSIVASGKNIFAGTDANGVYRSTDNGRSWSAVNAGLENRSVFTLAGTGSNLFAGTNGGVFISNNDGTSWTAVNSGLTNMHVRAFAVSKKNLFAGTLGGGVFLSTNGGASWTAVNSGLHTMEVFALAFSDSNLYAGSTDGVYLSTNDGASWGKIGNNLKNLNVRSLAIHGKNIFVGTIGDGILLSPNSGVSWTSVNSGLIDRAISAFDDHGHGQDIRCSQNKNNGKIKRIIAIYTLTIINGCLIAGTDDGVFLSKNNGKSWAIVDSGLPWRGVVSFAYDGTNLFAAGDLLWRRPFLEIVAVAK